MANEAIPLYRPGADVSATPTAAVKGKTFVNVSGAMAGQLVKVAPAAAGALAFGVAAFDAPKDGTVAVIRGAKTILPVTAGSTLAAGDEVEVGAGGKAAKLASGTAVGRALDAGTADADVFIELY
ncbi:DUF2190 family protein [Gordonia sp. PDNC005]|uniref:capsid cement protein n=1 Tax=Gordonia sp. PDNC005 TaxID=2811424 RepID=UPI001964ACAE|nr:capsid cement protein [Gordonia sp. PDNC005]QRY61478.1 DUF2190 family protein [Gordonia sp. PDNC005]